MAAGGKASSASSSSASSSSSSSASSAAAPASSGTAAFSASSSSPPPPSSSSSSSSSSCWSSSGLEASLDRKLQALSNTMESIQGLSSWCLENKRHHAAIARRWIHWMRRSAFAHRLNLFYLANDVIQNCKRKNAIVFRDTFAEVLPEAAALVKDPSVSKSIERIFKIWEDRNVYPEETIVVLKEALSSTFKSQKQQKEAPSKQPTKSWKKSQTSTNPKAALKSKIVAEFRPQSLVDELLSHKLSEDQIELKEKQLSTMRVDVCSTETLKCLKDKTGGKKFSKEFEEASAKLEEFVNSLDKQVKDSPSLTEVLENAGIFYEAQYKEVKVVANAYKTFANRVNNLKKKLDQLKATLPDPEESPVPSPSMDAPSPTGSESPFPGMGEEEAAPSPKAAPARSPSPELATDNRDVEDMELSDVEEEEEAPKIIVEERKEKPVAPVPAPAKMPEGPSRASPLSAASPAAAASSGAPPAAAPVMAPTPIAPPAPKPAIQSPLPPSPALALPNLANVDLAKISSILSSLTSVMKNTGVSPASRPSPSTPTSPSSLMAGLKAPGMGPLGASPNPLASILSKVEVTPESILSILSKSQAQAAPGLQGLSSFLQSVAGNSGQPNETGAQSSSPAPTNTATASGKGRSVFSTAQPFMPQSLGYSPNSSSSAEVSSTSVNKMPSGHGPGLSGFKPPVNSLGFPGSQAPSPSLRPAEPLTPQSSEASEAKMEVEPTSPSLETKIHNFLKGNPGFSGLNLNIPILSSLGSSSSSSGLPPESQSSSSPDFHRGPTSTSMDSIDGTPVRDERSGTPTQDEMMDKPSSSNVDPMSLLSKIISPGSSTPSSTRSPLQGRDDGYPPELPNSAYRPFGLSRESPSGMELPSSLMGSPQEKFYPDTSFQEDEDYRDFDYSGPPPSALMNLEKQPAKSILKTGKLPEPSEYPAAMSSYRPRPSGFGLKGPFPHDQSDSCDPLPSTGIYGSYALRGNDSGSDASPTPSKNDAFFPPDSNHSGLPKPAQQQQQQQQQQHPGLLQKQYPDSPHVGPQRSLFSPQNALLSPTGRLPPSNAETSILSAISATSTMEFKNMLKNASRKPSEEGKHFGQGPKGGSGELPGLSPGGELLKQAEEHFRIETRVSSSCLDLPDSTEEKGAPIETLGYHNMASRGMSGEPIQTVESIRVLGKGSRGHGREAPRTGWFEMGSAGSAFDHGPSGATEMPPLGSGGGGGAVPSFQSQYKDRLGSFQESVSNFRAGGFAAPFDRHVPPPPLEHGGSFPRDQLGPPPSGPPALPPKDLGTLFSRDHSVPPPRMPAVDRPGPFPKEASSPLTLPHGVPPPPPPPLERSGVPFPPQPPPPLPAEHGGGPPFSSPPPPPGDLGLPFPAPPMASEHGGLHQGTMKEHFSLPPGPPRDPGAQPPCDHGGQPLGRGREGRAMGALARDPLGPGLPVGSPGAAQRNGTNRGGLGLRNQRPDFRPREFFLSRDPFNSLKRPRPPFARAPPFFVPKRPFFPPRY